MATVGVIVFPGSNCDHDAYHALKHVMNADVKFLWHKDSDVSGLDLIIVPWWVLIRRLSSFWSHCAFFTHHERVDQIRKKRWTGDGNL